jgi:predicted dienelactone hydrolase
MVVVMLASPAFAVGFQYLSILDDTGRPIEIGIWYPSKSAAAAVTVGMVAQNVALNGEIDGSGLPTVIFSHGNVGWFGDRSDMALAFAQQGIVAVSLTYPGDNYKDSSDKVRRQLTSRPVVTSQVIDYVLNTWSGRDHLDKAEVGFYGFSAGGFTGLVELGGVPNWTQNDSRCIGFEAVPSHKRVAAIGFRSILTGLSRNICGIRWSGLHPDCGPAGTGIFRGCSTSNFALRSLFNIWECPS